MSEKQPPELRWRDSTQYLNEVIMNRVSMFKEFLDERKHSLTHQMFIALKVRTAVAPIIEEAALQAVAVTTLNFANIINIMSDENAS